MRLDGVRIGFVMTGSFCTFAQAFSQAEYLTSLGAELLPVMSAHAAEISTRFGEADAQRKRLTEICGRGPILTIADAEPIGPKNLTDIMAVVPVRPTPPQNWRSVLPTPLRLWQSSLICAVESPWCWRLPRMMRLRGV